MKDCKKIHPLLSLYGENQLSPREKAVVEKHLRTCPAAREEFKQWERLGQALKSLPEPPTPRDLHEKIMARLQGKPAVASNPFVFQTVWRWAAVAGFTVVFLAYHFGWFENPNAQVALKPNQAPSSTSFGTFASNPSRTEVALKPVINPLKEQQTALNIASKKASSEEKSEVSSFVMSDNVLQRPAFTAQTPMVLAMGSPTRAKRKAMVENHHPEADLGVNGTVAGAAAPPAVLALGQNQAAESGTNQQVVATANPSTDILELHGTSSVPEPEIGFKNKESLARAQSPPNRPAQIWSGDHSSVTTETQQILTNSDDFAAQWNAVYPQGTSPPPVDFTAQVVIFLTAGEEPTAGYSIRVTQLEDQPNQLVVHYQVVLPQAGAGVAVVTDPWLLQVIPKPAKPVVFAKDQ
jgi:hypothetical protein